MPTLLRINEFRVVIYTADHVPNARSRYKRGWRSGDRNWQESPPDMGRWHER